MLSQDLPRCELLAAFVAYQLLLENLGPTSLFRLLTSGLDGGELLFSRLAGMAAIRPRRLGLVAEDLLLGGLDHFRVLITQMSGQALFVLVGCRAKTAFVMSIFLNAMGALPVRYDGVPRQRRLAWPVGGPEIKGVRDRAPVETLAADDGAHHQ